MSFLDKTKLLAKFRLKLLYTEFQCLAVNLVYHLSVNFLDLMTGIVLYDVKPKDGFLILFHLVS